MGYVYIITNKINKKVYIGKTEGDVKMRWQQHIYNAALGVKYHLYNAIRKYGLKNFTFEILESNLSGEVLKEKEKEYIKQFDSLANGYNMTIGGEGVTKYNHEDIKNKYLELFNISETALFFKCSDATVRRVLKEYNIYTNFNNQDTAKPVNQYHLTKDILLNKFNSLGEAARALNKNNITAIRMACEGEISQAYGFRWKYDNDNSPLLKAKSKIIKKVAQLNQEGEIIQIFSSASEAAKKIGCDVSSIGKVCRGDRKTCQGYKWKYIE
jgi:hypothetical protein